tara:strand:- start:5949 stop:6866 length:918 start_codon:yes stop_codon:yes gene_type:complete
MKFYFILQLKRYFRYLKEAGFNPYIAFFSIIVLFIILSNVIFVKIKFAEYAYPFIALIILNKLSAKQRNNFLKNCFNLNNYKAVRLIENGLIGIPFFIFLLFKGAYLIAPIFIFLVAVLSQFNSIKSYSLVIPTPFHKKPFEFIVGFRKAFIVFIVSYVLTVISVKVDNFNLGVFAMLLNFLICMGFYSKPEPPFYVWIHAKTPTDFLKSKIKTASIFSFLISLPIVILLAYFNPDKAVYILLFELVGILYVTNNILGKYAYYPSEININHVFIVGLSIVFPPLMLLTIPSFYSRSKQQLNSILK